MPQRYVPEGLQPNGRATGGVFPLSRPDERPIPPTEETAGQGGETLPIWK